MQFFVNLNVSVDSYDKLPAVLTQLEALSGNPIAGLHYHGPDNGNMALGSQGGALAGAQTAERGKAKGKKDKAEGNEQAPAAAATPAAPAPAAPSPGPSSPPPAAPADNQEQFQDSLKLLRAEAARVIEANAANRVKVQELVKAACGDNPEPKLSVVPIAAHAQLLKDLGALAPKKD